MGQYVKAFSRETEASHSVLGASDRRSICVLQHFHGSNIIEFVSTTWETFWEGEESRFIGVEVSECKYWKIDK